MTNNKLRILIPLLLSLFLISIAGATSPTIPSGIQSYVPINLTNSQTTATPSPFQQIINITESTYSTYLTYNKSSANIEYFYANGTIIPAWIESNDSGKLITWVKTVSIPASSHIQVYLGFASKSTNLLSSSGTKGLGEAPQLSPTYAEYDDGASVFNNYWNFNGTSLPSGLTAGSTITVSVNDGITISGGTSTDTDAVTTSSLTVSPPFIVEAYGTLPTSGFGWAVGASDIVGSNTKGASGFETWNNAGTIGAGQSTTSAASTGGNFGTASTTGVWTTEATSTSSSTFYLNYGSAFTESSDAPSYPVYLQLVFDNNGATLKYNWFRTRAYPPSGVMPSVTFGAVQLVYPILSISPNPATYGQSITITATCNPTDTCAIDYPSLGTTLATGTGSATYTYTAFSLAAGTYSSFYANDITQGTNSTPQKLTINKASVSPSCSFAGASIANDTTQQTFIAQNYLNCTMSNHNNQLTVNLYYNGTIVKSGSAVSYLTKFDNYNNSFTYNTIGNTNYTAGSFVGHIDYLLYKLISATNLGATAYETSTVNPQYTFNITKAAQNATLTLNVQGVNVTNITEDISSTTNLYSPKYQIPLQLVNNTTYTFNAILTVRSTSFGTKTLTVNTLTQNELQNYFPSVSLSPSPNIVGDNISVNTIITQKTQLDLANVSGNVQLGNKTISEQINSLYNYTALLLSFIPSKYDLTMPKVGTPETYTATSVIKLSLGSQSVYRNKTITFTDYYPALLACNATTPTAVDWTFYNASNPSSVITSNVLMKGYFTLINNLFNYQINGTSAGWTATATASSYKTCIYPSFASFRFNNTISASTANTATSTSYYQNFLVNNITNTQKMYLLQIPDPIAYEVYVENVSTVKYIGALVKVLLYNPNTNSTIQISELKTATNSGTGLTLQNNDTYKLVAYTLNGQTEIGSTNFFEVSGACSSGICDETVPVGTSNITLSQSTLFNIQHNCKVTNNTKTNSSAVSCSFSSLNGASYNISLLVNNTNSAFILTNDNVCTKTIDAASGTLNCVVNQTNTTLYAYTLNLRYDNSTYQLETNTFGTQQTSYGPNGYFLMALLLSTVALAFITRNANFVVVGFTIGWVAGSFIGLAYSPALSDGFLIIVASFILYLINRR